jgi:hypothetical protein
MDFNYEKAYFLFAKPAFEKLNEKQLNTHSEICALVGELNQDRTLNIPLSPAITEKLAKLTDLELAELALASYYVGHWKPGKTESLFENQKGESWKVTNCIDQVLRSRLPLKHNQQVHDGKIRITFSSKDCWLWNEVCLATQENLGIINNSNLDFSYSALETSCNILENKINDLWDTDSVNLLQNNEDYDNFLNLKKQKNS